MKENGRASAAAIASADVRAILRSVHGLRDEAVPLAVRIKALAQDICRLTNSRRCIIIEVDTNGGRWPMKLAYQGEFGFLDESDVRLLKSSLRDDLAADRLAMSLASVQEPEVVTRTGMSAFGEDGWRRSRQYDTYLRPIGIDDVLQSRSSVSLGPGKWGWIGMMRDRSDGRYTERESTLVHAFHSEIGPWLWERVRTESGKRNGNGNGTPHGAGAAELMAMLSPAQQRVLPYLLKGHKEEQIAETLGRSKHTIHDHAKRIYEALGVNSRVDLVVLFNGSDGVTK